VYGNSSTGTLVAVGFVVVVGSAVFVAVHLPSLPQVAMDRQHSFSQQESSLGQAPAAQHFSVSGS
jgi:hypothetical protein